MIAELPRDYIDLLRLLTEEQAEYVIVGGWAVAVHGHHRMTKDLDVFVRPAPANAPRVIRALQRFGAPLHGLTPDDLSAPGYILQVGGGGLFRIDVTTTIDGVTFDEAAATSVDVLVNDLQIHFIGRDALLRNKRASDRDVDRRDVRELERLASTMTKTKTKTPKKTKTTKKATSKAKAKKAKPTKG